MFNTMFLALWFFIPAGIANVMPVLVAKIPWLKRYTAPIDAGFVWRGKRVLGDHKTWRGLIAGIIGATLALAMQQYLFVHNNWLSTMVGERIDYSSLPTLIVGPLFAIGALGGDAIESFFKRRFNIAPGRSWFPFDQTDYIIGGALATAPFIRLHAGEYCLLLLVWLVIHVLSTVAGYLLGLKDQPI